MRQMRLVGHLAGHEFRIVAARAAALVEDRLAVKHLRIVGLAPRRHGEVLRIELHQLEQIIAHLDVLIVRRVAARRVEAIGLLLGAVARAGGDHGRGDADIAVEGLGRLLGDGGNASLPAEAAEHDLVMLARPDLVRLARDAGIARGLRLSESEDLLLRHGLEQAEPDHRRGNARRNHDIGTDRTVAKVGQRVMRRAKRDALAVSQLHLLLRVLDLQLAFGSEALDRAILKLAAIGRLGQRVRAMGRELRLLLIGRRRDREPDQHRAGIVRHVGRERGMAAAVLQMAVLAGAGIEQRSQAVGGVGRGRRGHPVLAKDGVADLEVELALEIHIAGGEREGVGGVGRAARGGAAARLLLARFGFAEVGGRREQALHRGVDALAIGLQRADKQRQCRPERDRSADAGTACRSRRSSQGRLDDAIARPGIV